MRRNAIIDSIGALLPIAAFLDLAVYRLRETARPVTIAQWVLVVAVNALLVALAALAILQTRSVKRTRQTAVPVNASERSREVVFAWLIVAAHVGAKAPYWDLVPRWDAGTYFSWVVNATKTFDLSLLTLATHFRLAGHPSHAYGMYLAIGQLLWPWNHVIANLQNIALAALGIHVFGLLLRRLFAEWTPTLRLLVMLAFAFNPLYFGASLPTNTDLPVTVFLLVVITSFLYRRLVWFGFGGLFLCFSKEPGLLAYVLLVGLLVVFYVVPRAKSAAHLVIDFDELVQFPSEPVVPLRRGPAALWRSLLVLGVIVFPLGVFAAYHLAVPKVSWTSSTSVWNDAGFLCFGLSSRMFRTVLGEALLMNFMWIPTLAVLVFHAKRQIWGVTQRVSPHRDTERVLRVFAYLFLVYLLVHCLYINYLNPRYLLAIAPIWLMLAGHAAHHLLNSHTLRAGAAALFATLSVIQTWYALDPVSNNFWSTFKVGNRTVLHVGGDAAADTQGKADGMVYNAQFAAFERLYRRVNHYYLGRRPVPPLIFGSSHYWMIFYCLDPVRLDPVTLEFSTKPEDMPIGLVSVDEITPQRRYPTAVYVAMPWLEDPAATLQKLRIHYEIVEKRRISYGDYSVDTYDLELRSDAPQ